VAPKDATITQSVVNLKILKKEAESLGLDIGLVSQEDIARNLASQVGLAVYESIDSPRPILEPTKEEPNLNDVIEIDMSEEKPLKPPPGINVHYYSGKNDTSNNGKKKLRFQTHSQAAPISTQKYNEPIITKLQKPRKWLVKLIFIFIGIAIFGFLFYYFYPKATIDLVVKSTPVEENIEMIIDTSINKVGEDNKRIPGEILTLKDEISQEFDATGKRDVGEKASGIITLSNGAGTVAEIPLGTQVESQDGYIFITTSRVSVPAATASVDASGNVQKTPGTTDVGVEASEAGDKYNIGQSTFSVSNFPNLSATNSSNFSGGSSKQITIVSQNDIDKAESILKEELRKKIKDAFLEKIKDKKLTLLADSIEYFDKKFSSDTEADAEAEKFYATYSASAKTIVFTEEDYRQNIIKALGDKVPNDKELVLTSEDEITQGGYNVNYSEGIMKIEGTIKTKLAPKINYDKLKSELCGKSILSAQLHLQNNPSFTDVKINLNPSWIKSIPRRAKNITINKKYQNDN